MKPVVLLILDGWGYRKSQEGNAIALAKTPNWDFVIQEFPWTLLHCQGEWVGLSPGQMGNSEVGHLNIGAGRKVLQPLTMIDTMIENEEFFRHTGLLNILRNAKGAGGRVHIMGLVSDGGVHSHIRHLFALLDTCEQNQIENVCVHAFLDGRDTSPRAGIGFIEDLLKKLASYRPRAELASVSGRYFAMDRDKRWERTEKAYRAIALGMAEKTISNPLHHLQKSYEFGETDEFVVPFVVAEGEVDGARKGDPLSMHPEDAVIFFNFREDRARQLTYALTKQDFLHFSRPIKIEHFFSFSKYSEELDFPTLLTCNELPDTVTEVLSKLNLPVFKCAETEKYAHVTYFFNGGREAPFELEERVLVPSPKVATYDIKPEMSAYEVTAEAVKAIKEGRHALYVINLANGDMVGHTGNLSAGIKAAEAVDLCLGRFLEVTNEGKDAFLLITSDHGNFEEMLAEDQKTASTQHSLNPVPFILVGPDTNLRFDLRNEEGYLPDDAGAEALAENQSLRDIIPTALKLMEIEPPEVMNGSPLQL